MNSSRREGRLEVGMVVGCPTAHRTQGYDHEVVVLSVSVQWCIAALPKDGPWLCTLVWASPELSTIYRNTWDRQRKDGRRAVDVVWSPCVLLPVMPHFSFAFFCLCGSIWLVWNVKPPTAFSGQESPFVLSFFSQQQAQLGSWLMSST